MSFGEAYDNKGLDHTILKIEINSNSRKSSNLSSNCEFIFVMDKSGSMGCYVNDILTKVFPKVYDKLNFPENKTIYLLTFDNNVNSYTYNKNDFRNTSIVGDGGTSMSEIPIKLENILNQINSNKPICLLTLSDGIIDDQDETQDNATNLVKKLNGRFSNFNSQAIRFMSSNYAQPDTRALCSLLQLNSNLQDNNSNILLTFNPIDNNQNNDDGMSDSKCEELANEISKLFQISEGSGWILKSNGNKKFRVEPYGPELSFLELPKGKTTLFIDSICSNDISKDFSISTEDNSEKVSVSSKGEVTQSNLYQVYQDSIEKLMKKVIINKGIQSSEAKQNNDKIINFINILENKTPGTKVNNNKLTEIFKNINNDQTANHLNGNQLNDYINKKLKECKESIDLMVNEEINNNKKEKLNEFIILIDASETMENYIKKLQEILYETVKKLGFEDNKKIKIYPFNGEDPGYSNIAVKKLKKHSIDCESSRELFDAFQNIAELIFYNNDRNYKILTITSGEFTVNSDIRALLYRLNTIKSFPSLKSEIVVFKTPLSDFHKNDKKEDQYDYITFSLIKQFGFEDISEYEPLIINYDDNTGEAAEKISKLFS